MEAANYFFGEHFFSVLPDSRGLSCPPFLVENPHLQTVFSGCAAAVAGARRSVPGVVSLPLVLAGSVSGAPRPAPHPPPPRRVPGPCAWVRVSLQTLPGCPAAHPPPHLRGHSLVALGAIWLAERPLQPPQGYRDCLIQSPSFFHRRDRDAARPPFRTRAATRAWFSGCQPRGFSSAELGASRENS